ncbi:MAG: hypothetical protein K0S66_2050 [Sphingomonas sp.]|jgi:regulator of CtrA degradation|nr:DUF1465 family protein [Sphingomonas sp.]MDF2495116.1 hypothetical protein [Sphingomonas sp.]
MQASRHDSIVYRRLIDALYVEAMVLADDARSYFDDGGRGDRDALDPLTRVTFSCESLKLTTRLMHVIAWLLTQRAVLSGELCASAALDPSRRLIPSADDPMLAAAQLPEKARRLVATSVDLHRRVARLDDVQGATVPEESPARQMFQRLSMAF